MTDLIKDLRFWNGGIDSDKKMQKAADRIEQLEAELHSCFHRIEELQAALREIMNMGQSAVPDHWEARSLSREIARKALEGKNDE